MEYKDLIIPRLDVNDDKVTIEGIRFKNMDYINEGDILYFVETSKAVEDYEVD
jgi:pyruvate/2-oxoglutarate dehydrogenase complex dihydrolipoamide acyltransferase (E2) component